MKYQLLALAGLIVVAGGCGPNQGGIGSKFNEIWDNINDPLNMGGDYERTLTSLPTSGNAARKPWSDTYWPNNEGGISARWNSSNSEPFTYTSPSASSVAGMSQSQLEELSPAEKYDIFVGDYSYPTVAKERSRTHPTDESWFGICHGWAPASINFTEPNAVKVANSQGVQVPFGSSDVKALLSYYQGVISNANTRYLGGRCNQTLVNNSSSPSSAECRDVNAGAFHIVMANELGLARRGFVADITRDSEVWNQPIYSFSSQMLESHAPSAGAAAGTVREVDVETVMNYGSEVFPRWEPLGDGQNIDSVTYRYRLELDANDRIIGGEWDSWIRPDFLWRSDKPAFSGYYAEIGSIYKSATGTNPDPMTTPTPRPTQAPTSVPTPSATPTPRVTPIPQPSSDSLCDVTISATATSPGYAVMYIPSNCTNQNFEIKAEMLSGTGTGSILKAVSGGRPAVVFTGVTHGRFAYKGDSGSYSIAIFNPAGGTSQSYSIHVVSTGR